MRRRRRSRSWLMMMLMMMVIMTRIVMLMMVMAGGGDDNAMDLVNTSQILQRPDETPLQNENSQAQDSVDRTGWYRPEPSTGDLDRKRFNIKC